MKIPKLDVPEKGQKSLDAFGWRVRQSSTNTPQIQRPTKVREGVNEKQGEDDDIIDEQSRVEQDAKVKKKKKYGLRRAF